MLFRNCFCLYCERDINDSVISLHFPLSKVRFIDSLRFERLCSLFSVFLLFSSFLLLCFSAALLSFCKAFTTETLIAIGLCSTLKASRPLPSGHDRITDGFVRVFALIQIVRGGRLGILWFLFPSSFLLLLFFSSLVTSNFASGHHTSTPSFHLPFASPSLARRNARSD